MSGMIINAWLERSEPMVSLHHKQSNNLIAEWRGDAAIELLEQGIISCVELNSSDPRILQKAAHELLLTACANSLCKRNGPQCFNCVTGRMLRALAESDAKADQPGINQMSWYRSAV